MATSTTKLTLIHSILLTRFIRFTLASLKMCLASRSAQNIFKLSPEILAKINHTNNKNNNSLTAAFVYVGGDEQRYGTVVHLTPIVSTMTQILQANSTAQINVKETSSEARNAVMSLCYSTQQMFLLSGYALKRNLSVPELLCCAHIFTNSDQTSRQSAAVAEKAAEMVAALAGNVSLSASTRRSEDLGKIAAKLLDCCKSGNSNLVSIGARGLICLLAPPESEEEEEEEGYFEWKEKVCKTILERLETIHANFYQPTSRINNRRDPNPLNSVKLLSVIFDIFSSTKLVAPPSPVMKLKALLLCNKICGSGEVTFQGAGEKQVSEQASHLLLSKLKQN